MLSGFLLSFLILLIEFIFAYLRVNFNYSTVQMDKKYKFDIEALPLHWYYYSSRLKETAEIIIQHSTSEINRFPYITNGKTLSDQFF